MTRNHRDREVPDSWKTNVATYDLAATRQGARHCRVLACYHLAQPSYPPGGVTSSGYCPIHEETR